MRSRCAEKRDARVSVAVPHLAFCDATYWRDAGQVARYLRRRFHTAGSARLLKPRIFVLLRGSERRTAADGEEIGRTWDVGGLEAICGAAALVGRAADAGVDVECGAFDGDTPLEAVAATLGKATALVAAHGAGLANAVFLPAGARVTGQVRTSSTLNSICADNLAY